MKKLLTVLVIVFAALSFASFSKITKAVDCVITNTGPGSTNTCETVNDYKCEVTNDNNFAIINNNDQVVASGNANNGGNTNGGNATTGSASNTSGAVFTVSITNGEEGKVCQVASIAPVPTPTPTPTPTAAPTPTPTPTPTPAVLANTGTNSTLNSVAALVAGLGIVALVSTLGVSVYRSKF